MDSLTVEIGLVLAGGATTGLLTWKLGKWFDSRSRLRGTHSTTVRGSVDADAQSSTTPLPTPPSDSGDRFKPKFADPEGTPLQVPFSPKSVESSSGPRKVNQIRLSRRIVMLLDRQPRTGRYEPAVPLQTQAGMSAFLNSNQSVVARILRRLVASGIVEVELKHVSGRERRLKVYALTPRGEALARDLRRRSADQQNLRADHSEELARKSA